VIDNLESTILYKKTLGCLLGGIIGDAVGTPAENKDYQTIEERFGWIDDFDGDGTDDTVMKNLLAKALIETDGYATRDDWAKVMLDDWQAIFGSKVNKFFISVLHMAQKLRQHAVPRTAALGNMPSSSSAMCISPVGIVNAGNPRQAALQAYNLASLIHVHDVSFCQDGAAAMAAAVAAAFSPDATVDSVLAASTAYLERLSGQEMLGAIERAASVARSSRDYHEFRLTVYEDRERFFHRITCDSRETVPLTLALFSLADGDVEKCITFSANFGRDADTIASMCGAISGALRGIDGIKPSWVEKVHSFASVDQRDLAERLATTAIKKYQAESAVRAAFERIVC